MLRKSIRAAGVLLLGGLTAATPAFALNNAPPNAGAGVKAGLLTCDVQSGWGYGVGSSRKIVCIYDNGSRTERYVGRLWKIGLDIGYLQKGTLVWGVFTPTTNAVPGALAGGYAGATAGATLGAGGDVNLLVGGASNSFSLQPLSMSGNKGLNMAAGLETMALKYQPF